MHVLLMAHQSLTEPKLNGKWQPIEQGVKWLLQEPPDQHNMLTEEQHYWLKGKKLRKAKGKSTSSPIHGTCAMV